MIFIDKGTPPEVIGNKCAELIATMKRVHTVLVRAYDEQTKHNALIQRTDEIDAKLVAAYLGREARTAKETKATKAKLENLHYGELVESELPRASTIFTLTAIESTREAFRTAFASLHGDYVALLNQTFTEWHQRFPWSDMETEKRDRWVKLVWGRSGRFHQLRRIAGLLATTVAPEQLREWVERAYTDIDRSLWPTMADLTGVYVNVVARQYQLAGQHRTEAALMQQLTGYVGARKATVDELFDFHRDRVVRLAGGESTYFGLGDEEIATLARDEKLWSRVGNLVLAARVFVRTLETITIPDVVARKRPLIGWASDHFDSTYYSGNGIKESLLASHHGKCAYCEAPVDHIAHGDVEHFRPKAGYDYGHGFNSGGYFWQAYAWENLFYACQVCNQVFKGNQFPVLLDDKYLPARYGLDLDISRELPVLIDMGREDPRGHIRFNPIDGSAYPYDLVHAFYTKYPPRDLLGASSIEDLLWRAPNHIPLYRSDRKWSYDDKTRKWTLETVPPPHELYVSVAPSNFWDFTAEVGFDKLRGLLNIMILGLNRDKLVRDRVRHLRQLRGMFWAHFQGSEKDVAQAALRAAGESRSPYSSLSRDALASWEREIERLRSVALNSTSSVQVELRTQPWLACYQTILARPIAPSPDSDLPVKDAPIMYYIDVMRISTMATERSVVYLTADHEFSDSLPGWYLQIPDEDLGLVAEIRQRRKRKGSMVDVDSTATLQELFAKGAAFFKDTTITVKGPFNATF